MFILRGSILCFNPCFDGSVARVYCAVTLAAGYRFCFNPCFDGSVARVPPGNAKSDYITAVSILVLMEV